MKSSPRGFDTPNNEPQSPASSPGAFAASVWRLLEETPALQSSPSAAARDLVTLHPHGARLHHMPQRTAEVPPKVLGQLPRWALESWNQCFLLARDTTKVPAH